MSVAESNGAAQTLQNASTLKSEERRESLTFLGLSMPAILAVLVVVFLPVFWLSSLSFYDAAGALSTENYARIFVVYAGCGTGGRLLEKCKELGVEMVEGPHCYSFFEGNSAFAAIAEEEFTAFYLTDFLARQFDAFIWKPLGMDRHPELVQMYFGHYTKLVYQAQTDDPALTARAQSYADRLGLAFERRYTGYGDLATTLADVAQEQD